MKFDGDNKTLEVSVRELAAQEEFFRIGFDAGEGWNRLGLGAELHARVLKERCARQPAYRREVCLQAKVAVEDWTAVVTGRLDGCIQQPDGGWLIEEFKSTYLPSQAMDRYGGLFARHQQQLLIYCEL